MAKKQKQKAETLVEEAEKLLAKKGWFSSSRERNAEDAAEVLLQAANAYKVGGLNHEAGAVYSRAAGLYEGDLKNPNEAAKSFQQAGELLDCVLICWID